MLTTPRTRAQAALSQSIGGVRSVSSLGHLFGRLGCFSDFVELAQLLADDSCGQWQVFSIALHCILSLSAQDEAQVFLDQRIDRLADSPVGVVVNLARQRIRAVLDGLQRRRNEGTTACARQ